MTLNIFEKATKDKIRFEYKGNISVEDLWDLDVTELDVIYKKLNKEIKSASEDSLLETQATKDITLVTKIKIIKHIVEYKLEQAESRKNAIEKKAKKEKIMEILAAKQDDALQNKTAEELEAMLNDL